MLFLLLIKTINIFNYSIKPIKLLLILKLYNMKAYS